MTITMFGSLGIAPGPVIVQAALSPVSLSLFLQHLSIVMIKGAGVFFMEWKSAINSLEGFVPLFLMQFCFGVFFFKVSCTQFGQ